MGLSFNIARTPAKMLKILAFLIVQGALVSHSRIISEVKAGVIPNDRPAGFGGSEDLGMSRITDGKPRVKRCTCYSYMDRECVYYCHLDIIWVNTPERTVPYGMSSYQGAQRIRRETVESPRCLCVVADADQQCRKFCQSRLGQQFHPSVSTEAQGEVDSLKPSEILGHGSLQPTLSLLASPLLHLAASLQVLAQSREEPLESDIAGIPQHHNFWSKFHQAI